MRSTLVPVLIAAACGSSTEPTHLYLPAGFQLGTAIAGFQVEMGCPTLAASECDDENSDWYAYITSPEILADPGTFLEGDPPSSGPGHYELYAEDIRLADEELGTNALRFSIEWSRIFPTATDGVTSHEDLRAIADAGAIAHYHAVLDELRQRGMTPLVTLHHYTLPTWIHDAVGCHQNLDTCSPKGWLDRERTIAEIAKYAGFVAREFGGDVDLWVTQNEPFAVLLAGFLQPTADRTNPPAVSLQFDAMRTAFFAMIDAHARMTDAIRAGDTVDADGDGAPTQVGLVYSMAPVRPCNPDPADNDTQAAENLFYVYNMAFLNAVAKGELDLELDGTSVYRDDLGGRMDFVGINYYTRVTARGTTDPVFPQLSPLSTFDPLSLRVWEDYPRGLFEMIEVVNRDLGLPAIVTENGAQHREDDPSYGPTFLAHHLHWVAEAHRAGHRVLGYYWWTLMDNYEWNHGMSIRMGMYAVDKDDPQKTRTRRLTGDVYRRIIDENEVSAELRAEYPFPTPPEVDMDGCPYWEPPATASTASTGP